MTLETANSVAALRDRVRDWRAQGLRIGFVPTMGNLHAGHLELVQTALAEADRVVVSVFVNPMQFGPNEDYATYPRTLEEDASRLAEVGAHLLFAPPVDEVYGREPAATTRVEVPGLSDELCGHFRPGFFVGVATVVAKLFNMVQPDLAVFGEKDYQQLAVIRRMVQDLAFPIEVLGVPTVREDDGLAMSSRNAYLSAQERAQAPALYQCLQGVADQLMAGERDFSALEKQATQQLIQRGFRPDYLAIRRAGTLERPDTADSAFVVLVAAWLGERTRLIDNISIVTD